MSNLEVAIGRQYERGVVFRWGRLRSVREPGIRFMIPLMDKMRKLMESLRSLNSFVGKESTVGAHHDGILSGTC